VGLLRRLELAAFECVRRQRREAVINQMAAAPLVFIADEAKEMIDDATAGGDCASFQSG
jgi:hypothetical protein